jgi:hypothetical protein
MRVGADAERGERNDDEHDLPAASHERRRAWAAPATPSAAKSKGHQQPRPDERNLRRMAMRPS